MREHGYHTSFLYGGYSYFDDMRRFFAGNGFEISDRADIDDPAFANIWGVSDEDLFRHALGWFDRLDRGGRPFFSVVLTTSNHKPFTFPPGVPGVPERGGGRLAGVRYADHALGGFFRRAEGRPWFDRTLFVVVGDHGARVYGAAEIPLPSYEIPILLFAPGRLAPARVAAPISQIDLAPTVLGRLGLSYQAPFFGQDVLGAPPPAPRTLLFNHNHDVAALRGDRLAVLGLHKSVTGYRWDRAARTLSPAPPDPELVDLATAYYQTAYVQFERGTYR
jgi:phosphoglycerol transferase MdoB-like AlkP superfamily enzyme